MLQKIKETIFALDTSSIEAPRRELLDELTNYIQLKHHQKEVISLNFICTHNSRRSHLSQVWAQAIANFFNISNVFCYSGGTEATALFPAAAQTLQHQGFDIQTLSETSKNPIYSIKYSENTHPIIGFSKTFDHSFNPKNAFAAIMTCSAADEGCPFIAGAEKRIPLTFEDPKAFDNTPLQAEKYMERSIQIATELKYVFSKIIK